MPVNKAQYTKICNQLTNKATLVAVSKLKPIQDIEELYNLGQRDFGENYVQELVDKQAILATDIHWHFIGHLQTNKVKYIAPFVYLIHGVDSYKLLQEISKQAIKNNRTINCLLQIHIAQEETKFGLNEDELESIISNMQMQALPNICIIGLMGMASFSNNDVLLKVEFEFLQKMYLKYSNLSTANIQFSTLSMGMSSDYALALQYGSNMVRIGSLLFGARN